MIPMYEPLETSKCRKCGKIIAEPKELIRIKRKKDIVSMNCLFHRVKHAYCYYGGYG